MDTPGNSEWVWARETFGTAQLGDTRRSNRLVSMAAAVASNPSGTVTQAMGSSASREGAFRFLESKRIDADELQRAAFDATALRCRDAVTYVAIDQTGLCFVDRKKIRGIGAAPYKNSKTIRSIQVMTALALDDRGVPIGMLEQEMWLRSEKRSPKSKKDRRPAEQRESWKWVPTLKGAAERLKGGRTRPWFICDRAADSSVLLTAALDSGAQFTVRSSYERTIEHKGRRRKLWSTLRRQPVLGHVEVAVPRGPERVPRIACLELRAVTAEVRIVKTRGKERWEKLSCVRAREVQTTPSGEEPIEWKLLSNYEVDDFADALKVLSSYTKRWRIEDFHKTWKSGGCNVERSQLRSFDALRRWSTILAAVAARVERLKLLSREKPDLDALEEVTQHELDAAILLTETKKHSLGSKMTLKEAVALIAIVGGHMGRKGDGPPGSVTLRRGLQRVVPAAQVLAATRTSG